jgi:hypothetical protein
MRSFKNTDFVSPDRLWEDYRLHASGVRWFAVRAFHHPKPARPPLDMDELLHFKSFWLASWRFVQIRHCRISGGAVAAGTAGCHGHAIADVSRRGPSDAACRYRACGFAPAKRG